VFGTTPDLRGEATLGASQRNPATNVSHVIVQMASGWKRGAPVAMDSRLRGNDGMVGGMGWGLRPPRLYIAGVIIRIPYHVLTGRRRRVSM
jgi:hypothetical protein